MRVVVWDESLHEKEERVHDVYPNGIANEIAAGIKKELSFMNDCEIKCSNCEKDDFGFTEEILDNTDVLVFWAHRSHDAFPDEIVERIYNRVMKGMGLIVLHSAHLSKVFKRLMGTSCTLKYRFGDYARIWTTTPSHPIAKGIPEYFDLDEEEMYGEFFDIPKPDDVVFTTWFSGGNLFRGGCTWQRGYGKVFYFHPGHDTNLAYYNQTVLKVISNAVLWAAPINERKDIRCEEYPKINLRKNI